MRGELAGEGPRVVGGRLHDELRPQLARTAGPESGLKLAEVLVGERPADAEAAGLRDRIPERTGSRRKSWASSSTTDAKGRCQGQRGAGLNRRPQPARSTRADQAGGVLADQPLGELDEDDSSLLQRPAEVERVSA